MICTNSVSQAHYLSYYVDDETFTLYYITLIIDINSKQMDMRLHASNQAKHLFNESVYRSPLLHFIDSHSEI